MASELLPYTEERGSALNVPQPGEVDNAIGAMLGTLSVPTTPVPAITWTGSRTQQRSVISNRVSPQEDRISGFSLSTPHHLHLHHLCWEQKPCRLSASRVSGPKDILSRVLAGTRYLSIIVLAVGDGLGRVVVRVQKVQYY